MIVGMIVDEIQPENPLYDILTQEVIDKALEQFWLGVYRPYPVYRGRV